MTLIHKNVNSIRIRLFTIALMLGAMQHAMASDIADTAVQPSNSSKTAVFVLSAEEFAASKDEFGDALAKNGLNKDAIHTYVESQNFGFKDFSQEVTNHSTDFSKVMLIFHFHGGDAGGCSRCDGSPSCLQGNLSAKNQFIGAQQIVDDFLVPLEGKQVVVFFQSCFSGHFAKKVEQLASQKAWKKPTPIALIATDNNSTTSAVYFPYPDYARKSTKFNHWENKQHAWQYETMRNFPDFVRFVNCWDHGFAFTFFELNNGESIDMAPFGFKDEKLKPFEDIVALETVYQNIEARLREVDVKNLVVLVIERDRMYENIKNGDMWINAFEQNGIAKENIHWALTEKTDNPQVHTFSDDFDFIKPHQNVLLFVRGDEYINKNSLNDSSSKWFMMLKGEHLLAAEDIAANLLLKVKHAHRILVLLCSAYADKGFNELVSLIENQAFTNVGIVALYEPKRSLHRKTIYGWPMNMLAPLYKASFLFYCDRDFQDAFPKNPQVRALALAGLKLFESIGSFDDYLVFLQKAGSFPTPNDMAVKSHNVDNHDLARFGFLPNAFPVTWYGW